MSENRGGGRHEREEGGAHVISDVHVWAVNQYESVGPALTSPHNALSPILLSFVFVGPTSSPPIPIHPHLFLFPSSFSFICYFHFPLSKYLHMGSFY